MLGYEDGELEISVDQWRRLVHPADWKAEWNDPGQWNWRSSEESVRAEFRMLAKNGEWRWILLTCRVVERDARGRVVRIVGINADVTERRRAADLLEQAVADRDALLREVHHRVKNNLQIVSSLLNLQLGQIRQPRLRELVRESCLRVQAIALAHERLYQSESLAAVDVGHYVHGLLASLSASFTRPGLAVALTCDADDVPLPLDTAVRVGLIVNELLTNAYKHAFRGRQRGAVRVSLRRLPDDTLELVVADDGRGLPAGLDVSRTETLGLQLVSHLAAQLGGRLATTREAGARFTVAFPLHPPA
jgi:PAS domain S-box-containing protein